MDEVDNSWAQFDGLKISQWMELFSRMNLIAQMQLAKWAK
jgi:hypothetical protein